MRLHDLKPDPGSRKKRRRAGRGIAAGRGKTAGRGHKGQGARAGGGKGPYFEGGQLPLVRRMPFKRGFTNIFRIEYEEVNVGLLNEHEGVADGAVVTPASLAQLGIIRDATDPVVILGDGDLGKRLQVSAHRFTKSAQQKISDAGGSVTRLELKVKGARATVKLPKKDELARLMAADDGQG